MVDTKYFHVLTHFGGYPYDAAVLDDGTYDVLVVDAELGEDPDDGGRAPLLVDLAVLAGPHKGELITVAAHGIDRDPLDLLAVPGTVVVTDGQPHLTLEG